MIRSLLKTLYRAWDRIVPKKPFPKQKYVKMDSMLVHKLSRNLTLELEIELRRGINSQFDYLNLEHTQMHVDLADELDLQVELLLDDPISTHLKNYHDTAT